MTSYTLSPFLLTPIQTTAAWRKSILMTTQLCPFACCLLLGFFSHHVSVFSNLSSAEKASVKDEGRLLTDCAYEALTLWVCMFLKFHNAPVPQRLIAKKCLLSLASLCLRKGSLSYMFRPARLYLDIDYALTCMILAQKLL